MKHIWQEHKKQVVKDIRNFFLWLLSVAVVSLGLLSAVFYHYTGDLLGFFKLVRTFQLIDTNYAGNIPKQDLLNGALEGIVAKLGDKHSLYLDGEQFKDFSSQMTGSFAGIGVYISAAQEGALINDIIDDSPAHDQGLQRGDVIVAINGKATAGMKLEDISNAVRGPEGSQVTITIRRNGVDTDYMLTRRKIHVKTVAGQMVEGTDIGYIRVAVFSETTGEEFTKQFNDLKQQGMKKMILDLRDNPGGLVDQATNVASNFVPKNSTIMSYTDSTGHDKAYTAQGTDELIPMVVLINGNSASASEIVAGDVQDLQLGTIVGVKSYGKGTVQGVYPVGDDAAVKLTVAKYKTAKGRQIDGEGITPDVIVELQPGDTVDYQFEKAMEILKNQQ